MGDTNEHPTRRSVIQLSLGSLGAVALPKAVFGDEGAGETVAAETSDMISNAIDDIDDPVDAIISLSDAAIQQMESPSDSDPETLKQRVSRTQQPVLDELQAMNGVSVHRTFWLGNAIFARIAPDRIDDVASIESVDGIYENKDIAPPDPVEQKPRKAEATPAQNAIPTYGLEQVNAVSARNEYNATGDGVTIGVIDTGIDPDHQAFSEFNPDNFAEFTLMAEQVDTDPNDPDSHGTHVSGTALADTAVDPALGAELDVGVAPDATLLSAKAFSTFDGSTSATTAQVIAGIQWAVENGADVINMSLGSSVNDESVFDPFYLEVLRDVVDVGVLPVASAGNNGQGLTGSPGNIKESFSIAANDNTRSLADFSSGEQVYSENAWDENVLPDDYPSFYTVPDVSGPGVDVLSTLPGGVYGQLSGTSMSAPHVAGAVAQLLSADIDADLSVADVQELLENTALHPSGPMTDDTRFGTGTIDVLGALADADGGGTVTGTFQADGAPVAGTEIVSDFGTTAITGPNGEFELHLPAGENQVTFDEFGATTETVTVDVPADGSTTIDVDLDPELVVELLSVQEPPTGFDQPPELTSGESFDLVLNVANLDVLTVSLGADAEGFEPADISLSIGDTQFEVDQPLPVGGVTGTVPLTVEINTQSGLAAYANEDNIIDADGIQDAFNDWQAGEISSTLLNNAFDAWRSQEPVETDPDPPEGTLTLEHTFEGAGEELTVTTGPTQVIDGTPATFEIVDATLPEETGGELDADDDPNTVTATATIENTGDVQGTKDVTYQVLGIPFPEPRTIPAGETADFEITISNLVAAGFGGVETTHSISTPDDSVSGPLLITEPDEAAGGQFEIIDLVAPSSVAAGETVEVEATIGNTRPEAFSSLVSYLFDARASEADSVDTVAFRAVEINGESVTEVTFTLNTEGLLPGTYLHTVTTPNDAATAQITITDSASAQSGSGASASADD